MNTSTSAFAESARSLLDYQLTMANDMFQHTAETLGQLAELNLQASRVNFEDAAETARHLARSGSPQEALQFLMNQVQLNAEKMFSFGQHLTTVMSNIQSELKQAIDLQMAEMNRKSLELIDDIAKASPQNSGPMVDAMKSAIQGAMVGYEQLSNSTSAMNKAVEDNRDKMVGQFAKAAADTPKKPRR